MDITAQMDHQYVLVFTADIRNLQKPPEQFKLRQDFSKTLVEDLIVQVSEHFRIDPATHYFMCWGRILDTKNSLESYGIKNGTLMILHSKIGTMLEPSDNNDIADSLSSTPSSTATASDLSRAFDYRKELKNLNKHAFPFARQLKCDEALKQRFLADFPELTKDPSLFAVFTEISTISALLDAKYLDGTLKRYPTFLEVTKHFIDLWRDEGTKNPNAAELNNLFFLTDDEDEEGGAQGPSAAQQQVAAVQNLIQQQQAATQNTSRLRGQRWNNLPAIAQQMMGRSPGSQPGESSNSQHITPEMLRSALASSMAPPPPAPQSECMPLSSLSEPITPATGSSISSATSGSSSAVSDRPPTLAEHLSRASSAPQTPSATGQQSTSGTVQTLLDRLPQLQALRELGITDEVVAIQALEAANGDLEVAINIIFSEN